ncbi:hypothetical protein MRX96_002447 [Rhipicephalus microplus]
MDRPGGEKIEDRKRKRKRRSHPFAKRRASRSLQIRASKHLGGSAGAHLWPVRRQPCFQRPSSPPHPLILGFHTRRPWGLVRVMSPLLENPRQHSIKDEYDMLF